MTTNDEKDLMRVDERTQERVIESLVLRGDLSGLAPKDRARFYVQVCEGLGLNPASNPLAFLRLNGKEILYPTRGATDQLARIHRVNREIIDGPKVIDLAGTKLVYAVCRASTPDGRMETAVATVPLVDPVNVLMKAETKSKRRATLSVFMRSLSGSQRSALCCQLDIRQQGGLLIRPHRPRGPRGGGGQGR